MHTIIMKIGPDHLGHKQSKPHRTANIISLHHINSLRMLPTAEADKMWKNKEMANYKKFSISVNSYTIHEY